MIEVLFGTALLTAVPLGVSIARDVLLSRRPTSRWSVGFIAAAVGAATVALIPGRGSVAAILAGPWWLVAVALALATARPLAAEIVRGRSPREPWLIGVLVASGFLVVGATWLIIDRGGLEPFGFSRTIVLLTAVHFHVAGFVLTLAGSLVARQRPGIGIHGALVALTVGTPLTAVGFFGFPMVGWIGALLVAGAGLGIGAATVAVARSGTDAIARVALSVGGATLFVTMPLAAGYATGTTFGLAFLDIPAMAAFHGGLNVVGFAIPGMAGWRRLVR